LTIGLGTDVWGMYKTVETCLDQLDYSKANPWLDDFSEYAVDTKEFQQKPVVSAEFEIGDGLAIFGIGSAIFGIYSNYTSEFYYYFLGRSIAIVVARSFTFIDDMFELDVITPMPAWERYPKA